MIKTKIIKSIDPLFKKECDICFVSSFFRMKNNYKPLDFYTKSFDEWMSVIPSNSYIRLYVDGSILDNELFKKIFNSENSKLEIVVYECSEFLLPFENPDDYYHDGTFGTVVRYLPLYDKSVQTKYLWFTDLDLLPFWFSSQYIQDLKNYKCSSSYVSGVMMQTKRSTLSVDFQMFGGHIIVDSSILNNFNDSDINTFLQNILNGVYNPIKNTVIGYVSKSVNATKDSKFAYGFDELFCNDFILPVISKSPRLVYCSMYLPGLQYEVTGINKDPFLMRKTNELKNIMYNLNYVAESHKQNFNKFKQHMESIYQYITKKNFKISNKLRMAFINYKKYPMKYYEHYPYGAIIKVLGTKLEARE